MSGEKGLKSQEIAAIHTYDTELNADSLEWCPLAPHQNYFVCGAYQLEESTKKRFGRILLMSFTATSLNLHQTVETAAVLDQKWCPTLVNNRRLLGVANAVKQLVIYEFFDETLQELTCCNVDEDDSETLVLSLDWSTGKYDAEPQIVCSDSKGNLHVYQLVQDCLRLVRKWKGHDYEAWIACFYYWEAPNVFFSGGDDCLFNKYDQRTGLVEKNRKIHESGVTSMHSNRSREFVLATGSYDSQIRIWDQRQLKVPLNSIKMPGTLWRLKWDPFTSQLLLAACMWGGAHVINFDNLEIIGGYKHDNICYGADWCSLKDDSGIILGTCSFYDHLLAISRFSTDFL